MATNKLLTAKDAALKILEREAQAIEELRALVTNQVNRLEVERLEMVAKNRPSQLINQTTRDPNIFQQVSSEIDIPVDLDSQQVNMTNLNLSMTAALELIRNNSNYEESSENEDST